MQEINVSLVEEHILFTLITLSIHSPGNLRPLKAT